MRIRKDGKIKILFREDFPERIQIDLVTTIQGRESVKMVSPVKCMQLEGSLQRGRVVCHTTEAPRSLRGQLRPLRPSCPSALTYEALQNVD